MNHIAMAAAVILAATIMPRYGHAAEHSEPDACRVSSTDTAILLRIDGFKDRDGNLRVQLYGDKPSDFLAKGAKLWQSTVPLTSAGPMIVCVPLPSAGNYALVVLHDRNANNKLDIAGDGVGFSRNPRLGLAKPQQRDVLFTAQPGVSNLHILLNYRQGMSVRPTG